ncbi:dihydroneopterin aldolase, partial [Cellulomonas endophytica]|uniref:dihydroneopterin aldolase n=1 Tax=Cellulomonas endophytica TaxID=2494735 RepID=UPI001F0BD163
MSQRPVPTDATLALGPVLGDDGRPLDQVRLLGVTATGHHGVFAHERRDGQAFVADVVVHLDLRPAAAGDALAATVHYGVLAEAVHAVLQGSPADLIETVAERLAAVALEHPAVHTVDVALHKPSAPITVPFGDVAVLVRRDRVRVPVVPAPVATDQASTGSPAEELDEVRAGDAPAAAPADPPPVLGAAAAAAAATGAAAGATTGAAAGATT